MENELVMVVGEVENVNVSPLSTVIGMIPVPDELDIIKSEAKPEDDPVALLTEIVQLMLLPTRNGLAAAHTSWEAVVGKGSLHWVPRYPTGQLKQELAADEDQVPWLQFRQEPAVLVAEYVPAEQLLQEDDPTRDHIPLPQLTQAAFDTDPVAEL